MIKQYIFEYNTVVKLSQNKTKLWLLIKNAYLKIREHKKNDIFLFNQEYSYKNSEKCNVFL